MRRCSLLRACSSRPVRLTRDVDALVLGRRAPTQPSRRLGVKFATCCPLRAACVWLRNFIGTTHARRWLKGLSRQPAIFDTRAALSLMNTCPRIPLPRLVMPAQRPAGEAAQPGGGLADEAVAANDHLSWVGTSVCAPRRPPPSGSVVAWRHIAADGTGEAAQAQDVRNAMLSGRRCGGRPVTGRPDPNLRRASPSLQPWG